MTLDQKVNLLNRKKSGVFSCNGLFHNSVLEYHIIKFPKELEIKMKTPSLNFHFETDNFKKFRHFFFGIFRVQTHLPTERHLRVTTQEVLWIQTKTITNEYLIEIFQDFHFVDGFQISDVASRMSHGISHMLHFQNQNNN